MSRNGTPSGGKTLLANAIEESLFLENRQTSERFLPWIELTHLACRPLRNSQRKSKHEKRFALLLRLAA